MLSEALLWALRGARGWGPARLQMLFLIVLRQSTCAYSATSSIRGVSTLGRLLNDKFKIAGIRLTLSGRISRKIETFCRDLVNQPHHVVIAES